VSHRVPRVVSVVLALAVFAAACSSGGSKGADSTTTTTTNDLALLTTTSGGLPTTTIAGDPTLAVLLLQDAPSGFLKVPDKLADSGPTNLAKAINDEGSADGGRYLQQTGFVSGYQRVWSSSDSVRQNVIFLYRFKTAEGAAQYATNRASELQSFGTVDGAPPITTFNVPMPGGVGLHSEFASLSFGAVVFSKGVYSVQAVSTDGANVDQTVGVVAIAQAQFDRLP
jgi:hypothetical protein